MVYLFAFVACSLCFNQFLRLGQHCSARAMALAGVNYALAAAASAGLAWWNGAWPAERTGLLLALGAVNGALFFAHLLVILAGFRRAGVGVTSAFVGSGVVVPGLAAHLAWGEAIGPSQWAALAMVPLAVVLLRPAPAANGAAGNTARPGLAGDVALLLCLLIAGTIGTIHKAQEVLTRSSAAAAGTPADRLFYQAVTFATACALSCGYLAVRRVRPSGAELAVGAAVGMSNVGGLALILLALAAMPASVFYPSAGCLGVAGNALLGRVLWGERLLPRQLAGLAAALAVVVLASLRL
jgi:drug/metabolite transporter (DMT)-like permease